MSQNGVLVLTRHGESEWNKQNLFTGWKDPALTEKGEGEALKGAQELKKYGYTQFDLAFTSALQRAQKTLGIQLKEIGQEDLPTKKDQALNERSYGDLVGMNKAKAAEEFGAEQVHIWRRSYDVPPPNGESLKMTAERVLPYFEKEIKPELLKGKKILVTAHGNSLRALVKDLEQLTPEETLKLELATGVPLVYQIDSNGKVVDKKILS
ncbi:unnamed protein product [Parajaminaea phylloscopi]